MSNFTKNFIQKLSNSISNLFPQSGPSDANDKKEKFISAGTRRVASEIIDDANHSRSKRPRLHHDPFSLPVSRIVNPLSNSYNCNSLINDASSDISEHSNVSVSTSGVSSLNPKPKKPEYITSLLNTNSISHNLHNYSFKSNKMNSIKANDFMSSSARKILNKLDKLSTPITAADKIKGLHKCFSILDNDRNSKPYTQGMPANRRKKIAPTKAVTVTAASNYVGPIRTKDSRIKRIGFFDTVDLDAEVDNVDIPALKSNTNLSLNHIPLLKSTSTNTDDTYSENKSKSNLLTFTFSEPKTLIDSDIEDENNDDDEINQSDSESITPCNSVIGDDCSIHNTWRCETCFSENESNSQFCTHCSNIAKKNSDNLLRSANTVKIQNLIDHSKLNNIKNIVQSNFNEKLESVKKPLENVAESSSQNDFNISNFKTIDKPTVFGTNNLPTSNIYNGCQDSHESNLSTTNTSLFSFSSTNEAQKSIEGTTNNSIKSNNLFGDVKQNVNLTNFSEKSKLPSNMGTNENSLISTLKSDSNGFLNSNLSSSIFGNNKEIKQNESTITTQEFKPFTFNSSKTEIPNVTNPSFGSMLNSQTSLPVTVTNSNIDPSSTKSNTKPFTFGASTTITTSDSEPLSICTTVNTVTDNKFSFSNSANPVQSTPKPFSFGAPENTKHEDSKPFTFGKISGGSSTGLSTIATSQPFSFNSSSTSEFAFNSSTPGFNSNQPSNIASSVAPSFQFSSFNQQPFNANSSGSSFAPSLPNGNVVSENFQFGSAGNVGGPTGNTRRVLKSRRRKQN